MKCTKDEYGMFMKLFRYITGANDVEEKIMMTFPVSVKLHQIDENTFEQEMGFYLDEKHQTNPPEPTNPAVYLVKRPSMKVYTR